jgi:hypothetical protein
MFAYCTEVLHFSEATAYHRIQAARAARAYPLVLDHLRRGELHLSGVKLLAPHLTPENHVELLERARHQSKRAIEAWLADRAPKPDAASLVRRLPQRKPTAEAELAPRDSGSSRPVIDAADSGTAASFVPSEPGTSCDPAANSGTTAPLRAAPVPPAPANRPTSPAPQPLGQERFRIQFTASRALCEKLREAQALLRHRVPSGDLAEIVDRALTLLVQDARRKKFAQTSRPAPRNRSKREERKPSRHIPAEIKRAVAARDRGRCAFVARSGRRCGSRDFVEFHHKEPWAKSTRSPGPSPSVTQSRASSCTAGPTTTTRRCRTTERRTWSAAGEAVTRTRSHELAPGRVRRRLAPIRDCRVPPLAVATRAREQIRLAESPLQKFTRPVI